MRIDTGKWLVPRKTRRNRITVSVHDLKEVSEYISELEARVNALQKENTHLSLLGPSAIGHFAK